MPEDNTRNSLRVGGWIPPYSAGGDTTAPIRPTAQPALSGRPTPRDHFARVRESGTMRPRLVLVAALCLACAATAAVAVVIDAARKPAPVAAEFTFPQDVPPPPLELTPAAGQTPTDVPVSVEPSPSATSLSATSTPGISQSPKAAPSPSTSKKTSAPAKPEPTGTTAPAAPPVSLTVGTTVGLESVDQPGERVRHYDYRGRLDRIGSTSSDTARADSNFRVRSGLTREGCVSFESVNFPGYYLRHRNFEIRLDRIDRTRLFREDATFCTVTIREGAALALRSANFPNSHVVADGNRLKINETSAANALAVKPRPAL